MTQKGTIFTQSNHKLEGEGLNLMDLNLLKDFNKKLIRLKLKITKLRKQGILTIGAITKDFFNDLKFKAPKDWNVPFKIFCYQTTGKTFGQLQSDLPFVNEGSSLEILVQANRLIIKFRKNSASFQLPTAQDYYFFFNLSGNTEIQLIPIKDT